MNREKLTNLLKAMESGEYTSTCGALHWRGSYCAQGLALKLEGWEGESLGMLKGDQVKRGRADSTVARLYGILHIDAASLRQTHDDHPRGFEAAAALVRRWLEDV